MKIYELLFPILFISTSPFIENPHCRNVYALLKFGFSSHQPVVEKNLGARFNFIQACFSKTFETYAIVNMMDTFCGVGYPLQLYGCV